MIGNNLGPVDRTVSALIDRSYPIVKEVYLSLEQIKALAEIKEAIEDLAENLDKIDLVQDAAGSVSEITNNLDKLKDIEQALPTINALRNNLQTLQGIFTNLTPIIESKDNALAAQAALDNVLAKEKELLKIAGTYFIPYVSPEGVLYWTNTGGAKNPDPIVIRGAQGPKGDTGDTGKQGKQGIQGPKGDPGEPGTGLSLIAEYDSIEDLEEAHPSGVLGDAYFVGGRVIFWDTEAGKWADAGPIRGPQGIQGDQGEQGIPGDTGPKGDPGTPLIIKGHIDSYEVLIQTHPQGNIGDCWIAGTHLYNWSGSAWVDCGDLQGPEGDKGDIGDTGPTGPTGATFIPHVSEEGIISWTNDKQLVNPDPVNITGPAGTTDYTKLENKPTLGTLAAKNTVAISDLNETLDYGQYSDSVEESQSTSVHKVQQARSSLTKIESLVGKAGQIIIDITNWRPYVMNGITAGGKGVAFLSELNTLETEINASLDTKQNKQELLDALEDLIVEYGGTVPADASTLSTESTASINSLDPWAEYD